MSTLLLPAVRGSRRQTRIAFTADHLVAVIFGGQGFEGGFDDAASETEDEMEGGFLLRFVRICTFEMWEGLKRV